MLNERRYTIRPTGVDATTRSQLPTHTQQASNRCRALCQSERLVAGLTVALWQAGVAAAHADRAERVKNFALSIFADADTDSGAHAATTATDLLKAARQRVTAELGDRPDVAVELMTAVGYGLIG